MPSATSRTRSSRGPGRRPPARGRPRSHRRPSSRWRLQVFLVVTLMVLSVIGGRLLQLQGLDRSTYAVIAQDQRLHVVTLTAARGAITDRTGQPIAETVDALDVVADPTQVVDAAATATQLAPLLQVPTADLQADLTRPDTRYVVLAHAVAPSVGNGVLTLRLPGIATLPTTKRVYPDGRLASNVIGYVGADGSGLGGLESAYQSTLAGHDGQRVYEVGTAGAAIPDGRDVVREPEPGTGLRLTIQRDIQWEAQRAIADEVRKTKAASGSVVVMDPRNGQVLALAVAPGFNPNHYSTTNPAHLGDPAVGDVYEPGSVSKVITMSAALQDHLVTPNSPFVVPYSYNFAGRTFHDAEVHPTEHLTLAGVLAHSSNVGTIQVARRLGAKRLDQYLQGYGFGATTGIGLPGESAGILPPLSQWSDTTLPTASFGQGIGVTAMQVASVFSTIANGGVRAAPSIIAGTVDSSGAYHSRPAPAERRVISSHTAAELRNMLEAVTSNEGTAPEARIAGYRVAGKTGTAQRPDGHGGYSGYTASFVGMAPADAPKLVVEAVVQLPKTEHFGGLVAAPVFHDVMSFALQTLGIPPTGTTPPKARLTW